MPPLKTIAVTPTKRGGGRKRPSPTVDADDGEVSLPPLIARPPRKVLAQPMHRYHVGDKLRMANGGQSMARVAAACKVVALLPYEGRGALLYRVRSDNENFERVVPEADLTR
ncbi:MAG: hypothetical protein ABIQ30_09260 [Devosia sp.]